MFINKWNNTNINFSVHIQSVRWSHDTIPTDITSWHVFIVRHNLSLQQSPYYESLTCELSAAPVPTFHRKFNFFELCTEVTWYKVWDLIKILQHSKSILILIHVLSVRVRQVQGKNKKTVWKKQKTPDFSNAMKKCFCPWS